MNRRADNGGAKSGLNLNRLKNERTGRDVASAVDSAGQLPRSKVLWNNGLSVNFPSQQRLVEDEFRKAQVWDILSGQVSEDFFAEHPEPLFRFGLEVTPNDPDNPTYHQPDLDSTKSAPPENLTVLTSLSEYYQMLGYFNSSRAIWAKEKKDFEKTLMRANEVFDTVLGPRSLDVIRQTRREHGMAAAWEFLVRRYTPKNTHLGMSLIRRKWEAMRKYPNVPMLDFFAVFKDLRTQLEDIGRHPDNTEQFDRLKLALLFDDQNFKDYWGPTIHEFQRDHRLEDADFIDELETVLNDRDTEQTLQSDVQNANGTYSSMQREKQREAKRDGNHTNKSSASTVEIAEPEAAMHAEVAGKPVVKDRVPAKADRNPKRGEHAFCL